MNMTFQHPARSMVQPKTATQQPPSHAFRRFPMYSVPLAIPSQVNIPPPPPIKEDNLMLWLIKQPHSAT